MDFNERELHEELNYWCRELDILENDLKDDELIEKVGIKFLEQCYAYAEQRIRHYQRLLGQD
jgi:hypothetical protein